MAYFYMKNESLSDRKRRETLANLELLFCQVIRCPPTMRNYFTIEDTLKLPDGWYHSSFLGVLRHLQILPTAV